MKEFILELLELQSRSLIRGLSVEGEAIEETGAGLIEEGDCIYLEAANTLVVQEVWQLYCEIAPSLYIEVWCNQVPFLFEPGQVLSRSETP